MRRRVAAALAAGISLLSALAAAEVASRWADGYSLTAFALRRVRDLPAARVPAATDADAAYVARVPLAAGVDRAWYALEPRPRSRFPVDAQLAARAAEYPTEGPPVFFSFNRRYLQQQVCGSSHGESLGRLREFFFFDPTEPSPFPTYRHLRHVSPPGWFATNNFGWRGGDVTLQKSPGAIRIAFVGASTTIDSYGVPFSHPELVEFWLNEWARESGRPYRFEVINAGRSGIDSRSIAAVVTQELLPLKPDLVVFYEGANQFWPGQSVKTRLGRFYPRPTRTFRRRFAGEDYSAVVRRGLAALDRVTGGDGSEPRKPAFTVDWPAGVDEQKPDLSAAHLPMDLKQVVADLDTMRQGLAGQGGELAVSSFIWLAYDGMRLSLERHLGIYRYLNDTYWPLAYAHIRRMADFQNRVFETYARDHGLPFLDVASAFPQDPDLFDDAIHMKYAGLRLQAWLYVQDIVPIVIARTVAGRWPAPASGQGTVHPAFDQPERRLISMTELRARCT